MLYAIIFIVIFVIILGIWIVRMMVNQSRKAKLRHADPETRAAQLGHRPTFSETAREVGDRVFGPDQHGLRHGGTVRYETYERSESGAFGGDRRAAVNRVDADGGDPELPAYNDSTTMPMPPPATYSSPITARHDTRTGLNAPPPVGEAPPKYEHEPPVVRTI